AFIQNACSQPSCSLPCVPHPSVGGLTPIFFSSHNSPGTYSCSPEVLLPVEHAQIKLMRAWHCGVVSDNVLTMNNEPPKPLRQKPSEAMIIPYWETCVYISS
ncbi:hypothetical protein H1C71_031648, partial [Ictidomys tridecemlineatus]